MLKQLGRYSIIRLLGEGGMGAIYEAQDLRIGRRVAIKTINLASAENAAAVRERLNREARMTALLRHPNIITVYDFDEVDDLAFIVMEFLSGKTLHSHLNSTKKADWIKLFPVLMPCAEALDYAHDSGVVHLDIKPDNIMLLENRMPKILDFGLARLAYHSKNTQRNALMGTTAYFSPESIKGEPTGPASDQFSLAVIVYRILTGASPFEGASMHETLYRIVSHPPCSPDLLNPQLPAVVSHAIERALSKEPASRFPTCAAFLNEIYPCLEPLMQVRPEASPAPKPARSNNGVSEGFAPHLRPAALGRSAASELPHPAAAGPSSEFIRNAFAAFTNLFSPSRDGAPVAAARTSEIDPACATAAIQALAPSAPQPQLRSEQTVMLSLPAEAWISADELSTRQVDELVELATAHNFSSLVALEGKWLPGVEGAEPLLLAFREAARYLLAAESASNYSAVDHLIRAEAVLVTAGNQILRSRTPLAVHLSRALEVWKAIARTELEQARERAALELPNPFRAGQPLRPDQGRSLFRGRDKVVRQIVSILMEADQSGAIALLGPRRCGKTSLLQMLPALLPDCICVFFDMQDNPVESPEAFFDALYRQARDQAMRDRKLELPEMKTPRTFSAAMEWMHALDNLANGLRVLLCLDEFERMEDLFCGDRQDLLRIMGMFRATIQHRRNLRLLVSGVTPFDELGPIWNDHFINVRQVRVGHLDRATAMALLMRPVPDFPENVIPEGVAALIFERTGGQPFLLQLYGSILIGRLNGEGGRPAVLEDVQPVEDEALVQGAYYLRHAYEASPPSGQRALEEMAHCRKPAMEPTVSRWLSRRGLIDARHELAIPVLGSFIREELG